MTTLKQTSFAGGLLGDRLLSRSDQAKYATGLLGCVNAYVCRDGALLSRAGTTYLDTESLVPSGNPWSGTQDYYVGNTVTYNGVDYVANAPYYPFTSPTPPSGSLVWTALSTTNPVRLVKFVFNNANSYLLAFSVNNVRIYKNGAQVVVPLASMTAWSNATAYLAGNIVTQAGVPYIAMAASTNVNPASTIGTWKAMVSNGAGSYYLDIPFNSPVVSMPQAALSVLQAVNYNDVMTIVSPYFAPIQLVRTSDISWTVSGLSLGSLLAPPTGVAAIPGIGASTGVGTPVIAVSGGGAGTTYYVVTAQNGSGESIASNVVSIGAASVGTPVTLTWSAVAGSPTAYLVYQSAFSTGQFGLIAVTKSSALTYVDTGVTGKALPAKEPPITGTGINTYTYVVTAISSADGSESLPSASASCVGQTPTELNPNVISWSPVTGAASYHVYRLVDGIPGSIGITTAAIFNDIDGQPDYSQQPPTQFTNANDGQALFTTVGNYPAAVAYFQQRLLFANTALQPTTVWATRIGGFYPTANFSVGTPTLDADALEFVVAGKSSQGIVAMVDLGKLIIHTASAEYACTGNAFGALTPSAVNPIQQGSAGSTLPAPVTIDTTDLFVQALSGQVRDLLFDIRTETYHGKDTTIFSSQIFNGPVIVDMDWQQVKDSIVWCAMSNGMLYGMTYVRDHDIWAWHTHAFTNGAIENLVVVPSSTQDVLYMVIRRVINGATVRTLEQYMPREFLDTVYYSDFVGTDCSLVYNGAGASGTSITITQNAPGTDWSPDALMSIICSGAAPFSATDVTNGNQVVLSLISPTTGLVTDRVIFTIILFTSPSQVFGYPLKTVPTWAQGVPVSTWGKAVTHFTGLTQLAGQTISVLADGNVGASALNSSYPAVTVSNTGTFSIPRPGLVVAAGLPVQMDVATMPVENSQGETIICKHVKVTECCPIFYQSRDGLFGQDVNHLTAWKQPRGATPPGSTWGLPVAPATGPQRIPIMGTYQVTGQVCVRVIDPVPFAMSGIAVTIEVGDS